MVMTMVLLCNALFSSSSWCVVVLVNLAAIPLFVRAPHFSPGLAYGSMARNVI